MNINHPKNEKLLKQYPFLRLAMVPGSAPEISGFLGATYDLPHSLTIKVQRADEELMLRVADNIGITGYPGFSGSTAPKRQYQVMRRAENIFAFDASGYLRSRLDWTPSDKQLYARSVLWGDRTGKLWSDSLHGVVEYLVWTTDCAWHVRTDNDAEPFGELLEREMQMTVYKKPECGFMKLHEQANVYEHLYLSSRVLTNAVLDHDFHLNCISGHLGELCNLFQDEVYFNGMKAILDAGDCRGASGHIGGVEVLVGELCGYDRVQLTGPMAWVTFQLRPEAKLMYVLGMGGTLPRIRQIVKTVVKAWREDPAAREQFKSDKNVSVL